MCPVVERREGDEKVCPRCIRRWGIDEPRPACTEAERRRKLKAGELWK